MCAYCNDIVVIGNSVIGLLFVADKYFVMCIANDVAVSRQCRLQSLYMCITLQRVNNIRPIAKSVASRAVGIRIFSKIGFNHMIRI